MNILSTLEKNNQKLFDKIRKKMAHKRTKKDKQWSHFYLLKSSLIKYDRNADNDPNQNKKDFTPSIYDFKKFIYMLNNFIFIYSCLTAAKEASVLRPSKKTLLISTPFTEEWPAERTPPRARKARVRLMTLSQIKLLPSKKVTSPTISLPKKSTKRFITLDLSKSPTLTLTFHP